MSNILTIPPQVVSRLREGTHLQLEYGAQTIQREAGTWPKAELPLSERQLMERAWALIDLLGWTGDIPPAIAVDMREHAPAQDNVLPHMAETLLEIPDDDNRSAEREAEYRAVRAFDATA
jgi:hypothetical protein